MIPFVGPSYQLKMRRQGAQRSVNLVPSAINGEALPRAFLKSIPGLVRFSFEAVSDNVVLLMRFNDSLADEKGGTFDSDGDVSYVDDWLSGRAVAIGGAAAGLGGSNVIYSVTPKAEWSVSGDCCIEVAGRIDANVSRPRLFIRISQGATDIAQIYADATEAGPVIGASVIAGVGVRAAFDGPAFEYGAPYHLALQRIGSEVRFYVNGTQSGITANVPYLPPVAESHIYIGNNQRGFIDAMNGAIAWAKITNGVVYTGAFTPPDGP